jgi:hypothetical protein
MHSSRNYEKKPHLKYSNSSVFCARSPVFIFKTDLQELLLMNFKFTGSNRANALRLSWSKTGNMNLINVVFISYKNETWTTPYRHFSQFHTEINVSTPCNTRLLILILRSGRSGGGGGGGALAAAALLVQDRHRYDNVQCRNHIAGSESGHNMYQYVSRDSHNKQRLPPKPH